MARVPTLQRAANGVRILEVVASYGRAGLWSSSIERLPPTVTAALIDVTPHLQHDLLPSRW